MYVGGIVVTNTAVFYVITWGLGLSVTDSAFWFFMREILASVYG